MIKYYYMGRSPNGNLARVIDRVEFAYLDHQTGEWVEHARVYDQVNFEPDTHEITLAQAKREAQHLRPNLETEWLDEN